MMAAVYGTCSGDENHHDGNYDDGARDHVDANVDTQVKVCVECGSHVVQKNFERRRRWRCRSCNLLDGGRKEPKKSFVGYESGRVIVPGGQHEHV